MLSFTLGMLTGLMYVYNCDRGCAKVAGWLDANNLNQARVPCPAATLANSQAGLTCRSVVRNAVGSWSVYKAVTEHCDV
jgi:hypothetical protein